MRGTRLCLFRTSLALAAGVLVASGCAMTPQECWESLKGEGFPEWSEAMGSGVRGDAQAAQPSGFFTDRRSEQIERRLGGGF